MVILQASSDIGCNVKTYLMLNAIHIFNDWPSLKWTFQESSYISYEEYGRLRLSAIWQPFWIVLLISVISRYLQIIHDLFFSLLEKNSNPVPDRIIYVTKRDVHFK